MPQLDDVRVVSWLYSIRTTRRDTRSRRLAAVRQSGAFTSPLGRNGARAGKADPGPSVTVMAPPEFAVSGLS